MDGHLDSRDLMLNLDVVSRITNADIVVCDNRGFILLCSDSLSGCNHDGWQLNPDFLDKVYESGGYSAIGTIRNHEHLTRSPVQVVERFTDIDLPIIKILFEEDFPVLDAVRTFILSRPWGREYELIYSNEHLLELTAAGATKGGMILQLASLLGVARKDIYCIGDHKNDIPMLEVSAMPFAPANAIPAVHEFGAHIVSHCSDGAVADVVEYLDKIY